MRLTFFLFAFMFLLISCQRNIAEFTITNDKNVPIEFLSIEPNALPNKIVNIKPKETIKYKMDLSEFKNIDGGYVIRYQTGKSKIKKGFGYFTNGSQCESHSDIIIKENDSLEFHFQYD